MYVIIAADHRFPTLCSSIYTSQEYVSRTYARWSNARKQAIRFLDLFDTVTIVEIAA